MPEGYPQFPDSLDAMAHPFIKTRFSSEVSGGKLQIIRPPYYATKTELYVHKTFIEILRRWSGR